MPNLSGSRHTFPFTQPTDEDYLQARLDWNLSTSDTAFGRFTQDETTQVRPLGFPGFVTDRYSKNQYLTISETHVFSPNLLNTARVMEDNPTALRLKELETLEKVTEKIDKISVFGGLDAVLKDLAKIR